MESLLEGVLAGTVATIVLDLWALVAKRGLRLPTTNWALVGRWFGYMPSGRLVHQPIGAAPAIRGELALGWTMHYAIGIAYGLAYLPLARNAGLPAMASALLFAYATLVFPWLVLQPGLGAGVFASRTPRPNLTRFVNVTMHTAFGVGLYLGVVALSRLNA